MATLAPVMLKSEDEHQGTRWTLHSILLATDGSPASVRARSIAADLARRSGATLHVMTTYVGGLPAAFMPEDVWDLPYEPWTRAHKLLQREHDALRIAGVGVVTANLGVGSMPDAVSSVAAQTKSDLIIVGSGELEAIQRLLLGLPADLVTTARWPVLVVRGSDRSWVPYRVIVGFDHSPDAMRAADIGAAIASLNDSVGVTLLEAVPGSDEVDTDPDPLHMSFTHLLSSEHERLWRYADALHRSTGARVRAQVVVGDPSTALLGATCDGRVHPLLVVGTRGLGPAKPCMLGSVSRRILHHARVPTVIVPGIAA